jgi:O-antigen/teichoic acid export membrane protein
VSFRKLLPLAIANGSANFFIQFVSNIVLSWLLTPGEIGLFAVSLSVITIMQSLRDFGVSRYLVYEPVMTEDKVRGAFGLMILISFSCAAALYLARMPIAAFYRSEELPALLSLLAINFLIIPLGQPASALLQREVRLKTIMAIGLASETVRVSVSIALAALGHGAQSLVYASIAATLAAAILAISQRRDHLRLLPSTRHWGELLRFGSLASLNSVILTFSFQAPELVIGRVLGMTPVGFYSRASGLALMVERFFGSAVNSISGPILGQFHRSGASLKPSVLKLTDLVLLACWPALAAIAVEAETAVLFFYGDQWLPVVPLLQALCLARGIQLIVSQASPIYLAGHALGLQTRNEALIQVANFTILMVSVRFGLEAIAWARCVFSVYIVAIHLGAFRKYADTGLGDIAREIWKTACALIVFLACIASVHHLGRAAGITPILVAGAGFTLACFGYLVTLVALRHGIALELIKVLTRRWRPSVGGTSA